MKNIQCCFQRYEKKYLLTPQQYIAFTQELEPYMQEDRYSRYTICNLYYDTADWRLIRASLEKTVYKEKLRLRSYGVPADGDRVFVELKKKFDGVVYKRREMMATCEAMDYLGGTARSREESQICHEVDWFLSSYDLSPRVFIGYDRVALSGRQDGELRITFDTNLRWRDSALDLRAGDYGAPILKDNRILMEIKIPGAAPLWLSHLLSAVSAYPTSFSKYGTCYRQNLVRQPPLPLILPQSNAAKEALSCA